MQDDFPGAVGRGARGVKATPITLKMDVPHLGLI